MNKSEIKKALSECSVKELYEIVSNLDAKELYEIISNLNKEDTNMIKNSKITFFYSDGEVKDVDKNDKATLHEALEKAYPKSKCEEFCDKNECEDHCACEDKECFGTYENEDMECYNFKFYFSNGASKFFKGYFPADAELLNEKYNVLIKSLRGIDKLKDVIENHEDAAVEFVYYDKFTNLHYKFLSSVVGFETNCPLFAYTLKK